MRQQLLALLRLPFHGPQEWCTVQDTGHDLAPIAIVPAVEDCDDGQHVGHRFHLHVEPVLVAIHGLA